MKKTGRLRLGIYGGTFDPVHIGHLILARDALEQARLDAVLFVPCARSPFKKKAPLASDAQRVAMLKLALKGEPRFWLSRCELDRPAPSYAIDTAREIAEAFPRAELFWLLGDDQLAAARRLARGGRTAPLRRLHPPAARRRRAGRPRVIRANPEGARHSRTGSGLAPAAPNRYICH